jgi:hypothetical protein
MGRLFVALQVLRPSHPGSCIPTSENTPSTSLGENEAAEQRVFGAPYVSWDGVCYVQVTSG